MIIFEKFETFRSKIETIDNGAFYVTSGICLPGLLFFYRILCIATNQPFLLSSFSFLFLNNHFVEPVFFCYIPSLTLFFFLRNKKPFFFIKVFEKNQPLLGIYSKLAKGECYLHNNQIFAIFLISLYIFAYLYGFYKGFVIEIFFLAVPLLGTSYLLFKRFFRLECKKKDSFYIETFFTFSFFNKFLEFHIQLTGEKVKQQSIYLLSSCAPFSFYLCRKNSLIKEDFYKYKTLCDKIYHDLEKKNVGQNYQELLLEKDEIFAPNRRKGFFFYVACEMYGQITKRMHSFYNKIVTNL